MIKRPIVHGILLVGLALLMACHVRSVLGVQGNGIKKTEARTVADFTAVDVSGAYEVQWSKGATSVSVEADENLLPLVKTEVSGGKLRIYNEGALAGSIKVIVASEALKEVDTAGANQFKASNVKLDALSLTSTGANTVEISGAATTLKVEFTGASQLKAKELAATTAEISLNGACSADIAVSEKLKADVGGASSLSYSGNPSAEKNTSGAGSIHQRP